MATPKVYVICDQNCKFESMTKEQILAAIMQAVNEGTIGDVDAGFITTIKTINGQPLRFFYGEQSAYDALTDEEKNNLFAVITNDTTAEQLNAIIEWLKRAIGEQAKKHEELSQSHESLKRGVEAGEYRAKIAEYALTAAPTKHLLNDTSAKPTQTEYSINETGLYLVTFRIITEGDNQIYTSFVAVTNLNQDANGTAVVFNGTAHLGAVYHANTTEAGGEHVLKAYANGKFCPIAKVVKLFTSI